MMAFNRVEKAWLFAIIIAFFIVGLLYLFSTPPLESSDEYKHYPVVQYIQTQSKLPILDPDDPGLWLQEGAQPPLYYQLMAVISSWIDTSDLNQVHHVNKHAFVGNPNQIRNKNIIIHDREAEQFPWHGTILAIYIIRIASLILSSVTVMVTAYLGKLLMNQKVGLLAATLTAFNPMFLFVSTAVNNDVLANLIGVAGLYALVYLWQNAPHPTQKWWIYAATGGLLGLGILTKLSLGGLLGLAGIVLALQAWQQKRWELFFIAGPIVLGTALLISGWWFVRNVQLYGDLTGLDVFIAVQGTREAPITWAGWIDEFGTFYRSYWGLFGGVNILSPNWLYALYNLFALVGVVGLIKRFLPRRSTVPQTGKGIWILLSWTAVLLLLLIRWNIISPAFQGRLIFPALGGINILLAVGLLAWVKHPMQQRVQKIIAIFLFLLAWIPPWVSIMPAYAHPDVLTAVPPTAQ
ncbi:MAG: glycosyltransferase family 39 protein, partial [Chloroflexi bacterium]|nr:glycosyltransferase family 39 protein [Chloroflexota bacterium]